MDEARQHVNLGKPANQFSETTMLSCSHVTFLKALPWDNRKPASFPTSIAGHLMPCYSAWVAHG